MEPFWNAMERITRDIPNDSKQSYLGGLGTHGTHDRRRCILHTSTPHPIPLPYIPPFIFIIFTITIYPFHEFQEYISIGK